MNRAAKLSPSMSITQFDHGYWYATELKAFAKRLGIPSTGKLRKDQLEQAIKRVLRSGKVVPPAVASPKGPRDVDLGLSLDRRIVRYTSNAATKAFLEQQARKLASNFRRRSGARYRLNRWREEQLRRGVAVTYRDLVKEYVRLCQPAAQYARVPTGRYINFLSDFLGGERGATRADGMRAWRALKAMDCPKTYRAWVKRRRTDESAD
jgi:SAP domain-containing new25